MAATKEHYAELDRPTDVYVAVHNGREIAKSSTVILLREHYRGQEMAAVVYFPADALQIDRSQTDRTTKCPVKGTASYWSLDGIENAAWSYQDPVPEVSPIAGHFAFDQSKGFEVQKA